MFQLGKTLISGELIEEEFVCNLSACKGACCIDGEAGAPLEEEEIPILSALYPLIRPFLREAGQAAIDAQGPYVKGEDGEWETPLIDQAECAYVIYSENGTAKCGIEAAYTQGAIHWKKPLSCHLYPVRLTEYPGFTAVNYHRWGICDPACSLGQVLKIPVYSFVREALIRKFGPAWYAELEEVAAEHAKS